MYTIRNFEICGGYPVLVYSITAKNDAELRGHMRIIRSMYSGCDVTSGDRYISVTREGVMRCFWTVMED